MSRAIWVRLVLVVLVLAGSVALSLTQEPRLGLDLEGGASITLETQDGPDGRVADAEATERTLGVLRNRVDALGVAEPTLARVGDNRIVVELPGVIDTREARDTIGRTAQLSIHPVVDAPPPTGEEGELPEPGTEGNEVVGDEDGLPLEIGPTEITGEQVSGATEANDPSQGTGWFVNIDFRGQGGPTWRDLTAEAACNPSGAPQRRVAIKLDDEVISSPQVSESVQCGIGIRGGSTTITGNFTLDEAQNLAILIEGGSLPVPVEIIEQRVVGPTLGEDAIAASAQAAIIGLILTGLFIIAVYRLAGVLATIALTFYALIAYAALLALGATLTLPGLAGFVLAIGMAIDANVLVFERAREEHHDDPGRGLVRSLGIGYNKAWSAILDSNITTLLAAGLLFILASGPVRGFGVTLSIGVIASMFSALVIARVLTELVLRAKWVNRRPKVSGISDTGAIRKALKRRNPDLMGKRRTWLTVSAGAVLFSLAGIVFAGLNYGVEFTGGRQMEYSTTAPVNANDARAEVANLGYPNAVVQTSDGTNITVRTERISDEEQLAIRDAMSELGGEAEVIRDETIGPSLGVELRNKALLAFAIAIASQMIYLAVRFKWTFATSAMIAMVHDVLIVVGIFAWLGKPIDGVFLASVLTVIGLSVNDTIVVFDRIREQWRASHGTSFPVVVNTACIDTMPRTVNTGLGAMFILAALAVLGGDSLEDFSIALLIGLAVGLYSSVFTAAPLAILFSEKWPMARTSKVKRDRDPNDTGAVV
ncbi:MAG: protein translocase subunit SecD [Nocardioides sp.]|nr:protein translocase subunit SecD [Nocardioides sp.]